MLRRGPPSANSRPLATDSPIHGGFMIQEADAVVIGAGAFGASIAYHLAKRGRRVALLERYAVASQTSPRAAGLTQQIRSDPVMTSLAMRSVTKIEHFTDDTGEPLTF